MAELERKSSEMVKERVLAQIQNGELKSGDKLPNERLLSEQLGVSRVALREAFNELGALGILKSVQGSGTYVDGADSGKIAEGMEFVARLNQFKMEQVLCVRRPLEVEAAWQAAELADAEDKKAIHAALEKLEKGWDAEADTAFHVAVANAAGNPALSYFLGLVERLSGVYRQDPKAPKVDSETTLGYYRRVVGAIDAGQSQEAYSAMYEYYLWITGLWMA